MKSLLVGAAMMASSSAALAEWEPDGPIRFLIAFQAGGGVDTQARLLAEDLAERTGWTIIPENLTGRSGATMARALKDQPADGLTLGFTVSEALSYTPLATRDAGYELDDFTMVSSITGMQMAIIARTDRGFGDFGDVIAAAQAGEQITVGVMSAALADATYLLSKENDVELTIVMLRGGRAGLDGVIAQDLDVAWAAGVQARAVATGDIVELLNGEAEPLNNSPDAPALADFGVPFPMGSKFIVIAPAGLPDEARERLATLIAEIVNDPDSKLNEFVTRAFAGPQAISGDALDAYMTDARVKSEQLLELTSE